MRLRVGCSGESRGGPPPPYLKVWIRHLVDTIFNNVIYNNKLYVQYNE